MLNISNSRLQTFRRCHYAHYLKYYEGLKKKAKDSALVRGSAIHECIEYYCTGRSWRKSFNRFSKEFYDSHFKEELVEIGDIPRMVEELMENYQVFYEDEPYEYISCETYFELPLPMVKGVQLIGYIDAIIQDDKGKIWSKEIKTYSKTPDRDFLVMNNQSSLYMWALEQMGYNPQGTLWDIIRAKEPSAPSITKGGKLSQARIDSTPYTLEKGIRKLGLDPEKYRDYIESVRFENFLYRFPIRKNQEVVDRVISDTQSTARDIRDRGESLRDRNLSKECSWCAYRDICQAEMMGLDTSFIIKNNYEKREEDEKIKANKTNRNRRKDSRPNGQK